MEDSHCSLSFAKTWGLAKRKVRFPLGKTAMKGLHDRSPLILKPFHGCFIHFNAFLWETVFRLAMFSHSDDFFGTN